MCTVIIHNLVVVVPLERNSLKKCLRIKSMHLITQFGAVLPSLRIRQLFMLIWVIKQPEY